MEMKEGVLHMYPLINRDNSCSFSGYRPEKLPWGIRESDDRCKELKQRLEAELERVYLSGIRHYICGMARGSDTYFCEAVLELRRKYPDVTLEAAIPCEEQAAKWPEEDRGRYFELVSQCDYETYVSRRYTSDCMTRRNRYMVDSSCRMTASSAALCKRSNMPRGAGWR
jgi:uncharacterized phage-like protein YoqJ